jgi:hypothetical protein
MRAFLAGILVLFSLSLAMFAVASITLAAEDCRCKGCGCKGGPGWRGPSGCCVSATKLAEICGTPPGAPCKQEARVCFSQQSALTGTAAEQQPAETR